MMLRVVALCPSCFSSASLMTFVDAMRVVNSYVGDIVGKKASLCDIQLLQLESDLNLDGLISIFGIDTCEETPSEEILLIPALFVMKINNLDDRLSQLQPYVSWINTNIHRFSHVLSFGSGSFLLAEAGLLDGLRVTTTPFLAETFSARYPNAKLEIASQLVISEQFLMGKVGTSTEVLLKFVEIMWGESIARAGKRMLGIQCSTTKSSTKLSNTDSFQVDDRIIVKSKIYIENNLCKSIKVDDIAKYVYVSSRTLCRHFKFKLGLTPHEYINFVRAKRACTLMNTTMLTIDQIMDKCGYNNQRNFRLRFKQFIGMSPREYREKIAN